MSPLYADATEVPVARSRGQLEQLLRAHGAVGFAYGWNEVADRIEFVLNSRRIRFTLARPKKEAFTQTESGRTRTGAAIQTALDSEDRRRWRALLLVVRAKIEAVESGIASFDEEFLAHIVMANDRTVGEILVPQIEDGSFNRKLLGPGERAS